MGGMIPLSDASRQPRSFPVVTIAIIIVNALVFVLELVGGDTFVTRWSVIPADIVAGRHWITIVTALFMHGGWMHIIGNMVYLWAFGPEIEDAMGRPRYLAFYLLSGLAASAAQIAAMPSSTVPNLGASGAIAGVMGAFLITYPSDRIRALLLFGWFALTCPQFPHGDLTTYPTAVVAVGKWETPTAFSKRAEPASFPRLLAAANSAGV
jgi:membrane associated rhomboid family serine protease